MPQPPNRQPGYGNCLPCLPTAILLLAEPLLRIVNNGALICESNIRHFFTRRKGGALLLQNDMTMYCKTLFIAAGCIGLWSFSGNVRVNQLNVNITGIAHEGKIRVGLYNQQKGFGKPDKIFKQASYNARQGETAAVTFDDLPAGTYAIAVFEDLNNNGKLDANFFGVPKEPYAFSNNVKPRFSAPGFDDCKFQLPDNAQQTITLINP